MRKNITNKTKPSLCPLSQESCKQDECMWFHQQFEKCNIEIIGYNLFKLSKIMEISLKQS